MQVDGNEFGGNAHAPFPVEVRRILDEYGVNVLDNPGRFMGILLDEYGSDVPPAEVEMLTHHCDQEVLRPFAQAARSRDANMMTQARERTYCLLVNRQNSEVTSRLVADGMCEGISNALGIVVESGSETSTDSHSHGPAVYAKPAGGHEQAESGEPRANGGRTIDHGFVEGNRSVRIVESTQKRRPAFNNLVIIATVTLALAVGGLSVYLFMQNSKIHIDDPGASSTDSDSKDATTPAPTAVVIEKEPEQAEDENDDEAHVSNSRKDPEPDTLSDQQQYQRTDSQPDTRSDQQRYQQADPEPEPQTSTSMSAQSDEWLNRTSDYWGIWTLASKEYEECAEYVREVRSSGYDAYVTQTTMWANLNDEPWYVVTIGTYASENEANASLPSVQSGLDSTAYVKYSGSYIG